MLLVRENGKLLSVAPFFLTKGRFMKMPVRKIELIGSGWGYECILLSQKKDECLEAIWQHLKTKSKDWTIMVFSQVFPENNIPYIVNSLKDANLAFVTESITVPYIAIDTSWQEYLSQRSYNFRRNLKNRRRRIEKLGKVELKRYTDKFNVSDVMDRVFKISQRTWKAQEGSSISSTNEVKKFYKDLAQCFYRNGWLDISILEVDGKAITYMFGASYGRKYFDIDTAYDLDYASVSPGNMLRNLLLEQLFGSNYSEFDFVMPFDYKKEYTSSYRNCSRIIVFNKTLYSQFFLLVRYKLLPIFKRTIERKNKKQI